MQILAMILLVLFCGVTLIALLAALNLLLPDPVEKTRLKLDGSLAKSFLLGLVNLIFFSVVAGLGLYLAQFLAGGPAAVLLVLIAGLIAVAVVIFMLVGLAAMTRLLGARMGKSKSLLWVDLRGGLLLVLAGLTPYIGWFIFTPFALCLALGATILALFQRAPKAVPIPRA